MIIQKTDARSTRPKLIAMEIARALVVMGYPMDKIRDCQPVRFGDEDLFNRAFREMQAIMGPVHQALKKMTQEEVDEVSWRLTDAGWKNSIKSYAAAPTSFIVEVDPY